LQNTRLDPIHPSALLRRFHEAKLNNDSKVIAWGSGKPMREFLHISDMAAASIHVMNLDKTIYDEITEPMFKQIMFTTESAEA
jgi:GDP-L-fucose synthase